MAERKFLYMDGSFGYPTESDSSSDTIALAGMNLSGNAVFSGGAEPTGLPATPSGDTAAASKAYVDGLISGIVWKESAVCLSLIGNATVVTVNGLSPTAGDAYVMTDSGTLTAGSLAVVAGDLVEYDGSAWVKLVSAAGGFVPAGTRAILSTTTALVSPYTDATDDGKVVAFSGSSNTGADTGDAETHNALLIQDSGNAGYYDNLGFVFEGTVPTGTWVQFTGAGTVNAGDGLDKSGNTIFVGNGDGIQVNADSIQVDLETTNQSLEFVGASPDGELQVRVDGAHGLALGTSGVEVEIDATPDTLKVDANGLGVTGLPQDFKINDVATNYDDAGTGQVTAANLNTLTAGSSSNADSLHTHAIPAEEAKRIEDTHLNNAAVTAGRVVRWSATNNEVIHADNGSVAGARAIGVARTGGAANPGTSEVVKHGICAGCLTSATVNIPYFLGTAGALVVFGSIPTPGRVIRMGYASNASDLDVNIQDLGYKR